MARRVAISLARVATAANMLLSAAKIAPRAMIEVTTAARMPMVWRNCSVCALKYSCCEITSRFSRGSAFSAAPRPLSDFSLSMPASTEL